MVKRTLLVLGILSLVLILVGTSFAFRRGGCEPVNYPLYVPVDCPPMPITKTIVKTWSMKIVGPCPAPGLMAAGGGSLLGRGWNRVGLLGGLAAAIGSPICALFGGRGGVYGCRGVGGRGDGPCGPFFGPIPRAVVALPRLIASPTTGVFGRLW